MEEIRKIDPFSFAKFHLAMGIVVGVLAGIFTAFFGPPFMVILLLVAYPLMFFLGGLLGAYIYNLYSASFGGIKVELKRAK